jgi:hypothetical protein
MVTADLLHDAWRAIVTAHRAGVAFSHDTNKILDRATDVAWPACFWQLPTMGAVQDADILRPTFKIDLMFLDQTASDRAALEMLDAHARMAAIAIQCWTRFHDLYVVDTNTVEGVALDLAVTGSPSLTPVWDDGPTMLTGVRLTATLRDAGPVECVDAYFA